MIGSPLLGACFSTEDGRRGAGHARRFAACSARRLLIAHRRPSAPIRRSSREILSHLVRRAQSPGPPSDPAAGCGRGAALVLHTARDGNGCRSPADAGCCSAVDDRPSPSRSAGRDPRPRHPSGRRPAPHSSSCFSWLWRQRAGADHPSPTARSATGSSGPVGEG